MRFVSLAQQAVLLAQLRGLLLQFGEAAPQVAQLEGLVAILATGGFEISAGGIVGGLEVAVVLGEGEERFGIGLFGGRGGFGT